MLKEKKPNTSPIKFSRAWTCLFMLLFALPTGCRIDGTWSNNPISDALVVSYRDLVWSRRAYNLRYGGCQRPYERHFQSGFCEGYQSVCNGGDGTAPTLPPESYRSYEYQTADGENCIKAWFEGYPAGVAAAKQDDAGTYHDVIVSRLVESATENKHLDTPDGLTEKRIPIVKGAELKGQFRSAELNRAITKKNSRSVLQPITNRELKPFPRSPSVAEIPPVYDASEGSGLLVR